MTNLISPGGSFGGPVQGLKLEPPIRDVCGGAKLVALLSGIRHYSRVFNVLCVCELCLNTNSHGKLLTTTLPRPTSMSIYWFVLHVLHMGSLYHYILILVTPTYIMYCVNVMLCFVDCLCVFVWEPSSKILYCMCWQCSSLTSGVKYLSMIL